MKKVVILSAALAAALFFQGAVRGVEGTGSKADALRYNDVQWLSAHNTYQQKVGVMTILKDYNIRSIEFDIHADKKSLAGVEKAPDGDWLVYHSVVDDWSSCSPLSECFGIVRQFHDEQPDHDVITIFFDMAGVGGPGHAPDDLYSLMRRSFPEGSIFAPGDLMRACPAAANLQEAVTKDGCAWPRLDEMKGKFIFVVSDGREAFQKAGYDPRRDLLFLVNKNGKEATMGNDPDLVFFNLSGPNPFAAVVDKAGFVSRCYFLDKEEDFVKARQNGANHLATDRIDPKAYPWSVTADGQGRPCSVIAGRSGGK